MSNESKLRGALEMLVGASEPNELRTMRRVIEEASGGDESAAAALHAIDTLIEVPASAAAELDRAALLLGEERSKRVAAETAASEMKGHVIALLNLTVFYPNEEEKAAIAAARKAVGGE
jgi:hypothetical protein